MKPIYKNFNLHSIMELICEFIRLILQSIKLIYQSTTVLILLRCGFLRLRIHNRKGFCICRVLIHEWDYHVVKQYQTASRLGIGDVHELFF